jgi:hypothetical protein
VIRTGKNPMAVYRFIASGVFGPEALSGGVGVGIMGIVFHFIIAMGWTILFFMACSKVRLLLMNWVISGIAYGLFVWLMMNLVVLPLSYVPQLPITLNGFLVGVCVLIFCIGFPIAFLALRYYRFQK